MVDGGCVCSLPSLDCEESVRDDARSATSNVALAGREGCSTDRSCDRFPIGQDLGARGPKGFDAGKNVKGRKRHLVVDVLGLLLAVLVHPANIQDRDGVTPVLAQAVSKYPSLRKLYVDGGYTGVCAHSLRTRYKLDVDVVRRPSVAGTWSDSQLPLFATEARPFPILPRRWVVERTHSFIERPRRLSKD